MTDIDPLSPLRRIGWHETAIPPPPFADAKLARVIVQHRNAFEVHDGGSVWWARTKSSARRRDVEDAVRPSVGDWVWMSPAINDEWQIEALLPRHSQLRRVAAGETGREQIIAANIDPVLIVCGLDSSLELIAPKGNEGLAKFLEKRGPGLHHVAVEVEGIEAALAFLKGIGVPLIDEAPRKGARGHKVALVHPKATGGVLVELVEPDEQAHT